VTIVHKLFAGQAAQNPGSMAVLAAGTQLTYRELDQSANRLAHYLGEIGAGPESLIGVYAERGAEVIRDLLAIMKAGGGYLPLDPSLPAARLAEICAEARPMTILTDREFPVTGTNVLPVAGGGQQGLAADLARQPATAPDVSVHPDSVCYVIYTSGSTGHPKGVAVSHGALACVIADVSREYQISPQDRVALLTSLAFDTSVEQILVTLTSGATLILPPPGTMAAPDLLRYLERKQVTVIDLTPAYWHQLLAITEPDDPRLRSLRLMITGGEAADPADCLAAMRAAPRGRLLNAYGLTETTITSALFDAGAYRGAAEPPTRVPVGRPAGQVRITVLDEKLNPVPAGTAGEIYIGGPGVARGYLGRPELTAERFLPGPGGAPGGRMYRTGDLGLWREDGNLEVIGRIDRQLKVRGFRVEPAEIERVLATHPDIGRATVAATGQGSGDTQLTACYMLSGDGPAPSALSLRRFLGERLPSHMIPAEFIAAGHGPAPLSPAPLSPAPLSPAPLSPAPLSTPTQAGMSFLWSALLKKDRVDLDDDFFALGGNSLLAAEMLAHARVMFGITAEHVRALTRSLLRDPTLRAFAKATEDARAGKLANGAEPAIDFAWEAELGFSIVTGPRRRRLAEVLLTGATGFLGAHLLRELLDATEARIWCLVRADDAAHATRRITAAAARYELPQPPGDRVVALPGNLAAPHLGLPSATFGELARNVDIIYHAGAAVNFIYPYQELRAANVAGTREMIRLASLGQGIPVHFVSTTAVLAGLGVAGVRAVTEDAPLAHAGRLRVGYVETKFVAEELLRNAGRAGLPVTIYRPLDIAGSCRTGAWNTATEMCALIRFITDTGLAPDIDLPLDFVPVDTCAAAIRYISTSAEAAGRTYHLASPRYALLGSLVERLRAHGFGVTEIPFDEWVGGLMRHAARNPSHPMAAFLPLFVDRDTETGLSVAEMYLEHVFPAYNQSNTVRALTASGIVFPPVDDELLDRTINAAHSCRLTAIRTGSRSRSHPMLVAALSRSAAI
jgi:amino acid adenylation domain-containing protein/thioester reductase-like protein